MKNGITRLAPSPTGALHLGNARTFVLNALLARSQNWRMLFRMEDLDGPRVKAGSDKLAFDDLNWLGLNWETPVVYQSQRTQFYLDALDELKKSGLVYPCICSRKDIMLAASAPHADDNLRTYPGTCRGRFDSAQQATEQSGRAVAWRLAVDDAVVEFDDKIAGHQKFNLRETCGDFIIFRNEGIASYQLAVTVDDSAAGVNQIVRGDDLLESAARQIYLRQILGLSDDVTYWHLPLVKGVDGLRLAKRHGDTRVASYRAQGTTPQQILGLIAFWSGQIPTLAEIDFAELVRIFDPDKIPHQPVVFTKEHDNFLLRK